MLLFKIGESESLLRASTREYLRTYEPNVSGEPVSGPTPRQMAQLGWTDLYAADMEALHLGVIQHELGFSALSVPFAEMLTACLCLARTEGSESDELIGAIANGDPIFLLGSTTSIGCFVELGGRISTVREVLASWESMAVRWLAPIASEDGGVRIWELSPSAARIHSEATPVLDDEAISAVSLDGVEGKLLGWLDSRAWSEVESFHRLLLACELLGLSERALCMTREHVKTREQFGRFLGDLPVVRHKLADAFTEFQTAALAIYEALDIWRPLARDNGADHSRSSRIAIYVAGRAAETVMATASQLHGGSGFMAQHPLTHLFRRAKALRLRSGGEKVHLDSLSDILLVPDSRPPYIEASAWSD